VIDHRSSTARQIRSYSHVVAARQRKPPSNAVDEMLADEMRMLATGSQAPEKSEPLVLQEEVLMVFTSFQSTTFQSASGGHESRQMQVVWQLRVVAPVAPVPKVTPRKT
jgi:hypothetical protein